MISMILLTSLTKNLVTLQALPFQADLAACHDVASRFLEPVVPFTEEEGHSSDG